MNLLKYSIPVFLILSLAACSSTTKEGTSEVLTNTIPFMQSCNNEDIEGKGPISQTLYVVGSFSDSDWKHVDHRKYTYKGNNIYQVVTEEKVGTYKMQYASFTWSPQFTAKDLKLPIGERAILRFGGYGSDTEVHINENGRYVWSLQFNNDGSPNSIMLNKCQ
ncbi:glycosidase [Vibrio cincinnatiensis]|uniref:glycosidase n=1 Tax=Vibrio cincinnatiensis TaxID=675 RepID=UPI00389F5A45